MNGPEKIAEKMALPGEEWVWEARLPGRFGISRNDLRGLRQRMLREGVDWRREGGDENGRIEISATGLARLEGALALCGPEKTVKDALGASCAADGGVKNGGVSGSGVKAALLREGFVDPAHLVRADQGGLVELVCVRGYTIRNPKLVEATAVAGNSSRLRCEGNVLVRVRDNSNFGPGMRFLARREAERMFVFEQGLWGHPEKAGPKGKLPRVRGRW